jgi:hypothetical protein
MSYSRSLMRRKAWRRNARKGGAVCVPNKHRCDTNDVLQEMAAVRGSSSCKETVIGPCLDGNIREFK